MALRGARLPIPPGLPPELSALMQSCWQADPAKRPGFDALVSCFELLIRGCDDEEETASALHKGADPLWLGADTQGCGELGVASDAKQRPRNPDTAAGTGSAAELQPELPLQEPGAVVSAGAAVVKHAGALACSRFLGGWE